MKCRTRRNLAILPTLFVSITLISGCATMQIRSDFDPKANFTELKTYDWSASPKTNQEDPRINYSLLDTRVKNAVNAQLGLKGYERKGAEAPDFYVNYYVTTKDKVEFRTYNSNYGTYWGGPGSVEAYQYVEGMLILDVLQPDGKSVLWRGWAEAEIDLDATPERREKRINEAVAKILDRFPPGRAAKTEKK